MRICLLGSVLILLFLVPARASDTVDASCSWMSESLKNPMPLAKLVSNLRGLQQRDFESAAAFEARQSRVLHTIAGGRVWLIGDADGAWAYDADNERLTLAFDRAVAGLAAGPEIDQVPERYIHLDVITKKHSTQYLAQNSYGVRVRVLKYVKEGFGVGTSSEGYRVDVPNVTLEIAPAQAKHLAAELRVVMGGTIGGPYYDVVTYEHAATVTEPVASFEQYEIVTVAAPCVGFWNAKTKTLIAARATKNVP